ncbi:MAG TPA: dihydrofolate reductase family protein [Myxococcaceae bacterium]|jgi:dihydrofolate reductase
MRRVIAMEFMTLDGVVQSPSYPDEDRTGGFKHGGWNGRFLEDVSMRWVLESVAGAGGYLLGRRTYQLFAAHWPKASKEEQALAEPLNTRPKYVASRTLREPLEWQHARLLQGDVAEAVAALKREPGGDLFTPGSTELVRTLLDHHLVDELRVMIDPVVVGGGKRLFRDDGELRAFKLVQSQAVSTGAIIATYVPA